MIYIKIERANQTFQNLLAQCSDRLRWSQDVPLRLVNYNRTPHSVTKYKPCVTLYSYLCNSLEEVPLLYKTDLSHELKKYDNWVSMRLVVQSEVKVGTPL